MTTTPAPFKNESQSIDLIGGTAYQGSIQADLTSLTAAFGAPNADCHPEDKVRQLFILRWSDGLIATIYDWRGIAAASNCWHIGGHDREAVLRVHDAFRSARGLTARAVA